MKLNTTDFALLKALSNGNRNNAVNLAHILDKNRAYVNTRLPILDDYNLVKKVGPAPNSGLYEITEKGKAAIAHQADYGADNADFDALVESGVQAETADAT